MGKKTPDMVNGWLRNGLYFAFLPAAADRATLRDQP
jgi:hypothetical protein